MATMMELAHCSGLAMQECCVSARLGGSSSRLSVGWADARPSRRAGSQRDNTLHSSSQSLSLNLSGKRKVSSRRVLRTSALQQQQQQPGGGVEVGHSGAEENGGAAFRDQSVRDQSGAILLSEASSSGSGSAAGSVAVAQAEAEESADESFALGGGLIILALVAAVGGVAGLSYVFRDQLNLFLDVFADFLTSFGPMGYVIFLVCYTFLEVLAIPAIPLTMTAGLLFGIGPGTFLVSIGNTMAATTAFLIARYLARDRVLAMAKGNKKFLAIDKAIGRDSFRVVLLLRLSPIFPFSLGNYLYGLTSVELTPYILASYIGMIPGSWAYVSAGAIGRTLLKGGQAAGPELWQVGLGLTMAVAGIVYISKIAKEAIKDID